MSDHLSFILVKSVWFFVWSGVFCCLFKGKTLYCKIKLKYLLENKMYS